MKKTIFFIIILFIITTVNITAPAAVLEVNQSSGPYTTITNAISAASSGDIIEISDSAVYIENVFVDKPYLTIRAGNGVNPIITYSNNPVITVGYNNVTLNGLTIQMGSGTMAQPVVDVYADNTTIDNCTITADNTTFNYTGIKINSSYTSNRIENCNIGGNLYTAISNAGYATTIIYNEIHNSTYGIVMSVYGNIYMNVIHDMMLTGIDIRSSYADINIFYNTIYNCSDSGINSSYENSLKIFNNVITKNNYGAYLHYYNAGYYANFENNIIYNNAIYDIYIDNNNGGSSGYYLNNNCYTSLWTNNGGNYYLYDNINNNPLFKDSDNNDFSLLADSPCRDAGYYIDYTVFNENFPPAYETRDIGAYEYIPTETTATTTTTENISKEENSITVSLSENNLHPGDILSINVENFDKITSSDSLFISAEIYSITGKKIRTLENKIINTSAQLNLIWDGKDLNNRDVKSGLYLLYIKANNTVKTEKFYWIR